MSRVTLVYFTFLIKKINSLSYSNVKGQRSRKGLFSAYCSPFACCFSLLHSQIEHICCEMHTKRCDNDHLRNTCCFHTDLLCCHGNSQCVFRCGPCLLKATTCITIDSQQAYLETDQRQRTLLEVERLLINCRL